MSGRLLEKIPLPNGLTLELWDRSRPLAGDRWLVSLLAKVEIPILPAYFAELEHGEQAYQELVAAHGERLLFTHEKIRHFIDARETEAVLSGLCQRLKRNLLPYLGNAKFASLYALKKYGDLKDRQRWSARDS